MGCEWGTATALLVQRAKGVVGTDISPAVMERARERHPDIRFQVLDAFDVRAALNLCEQFAKVSIDVSGLSGYRSLLDVIALLQMYATVRGPCAIIIKSGALKSFATGCIAWRSTIQG